jgi:mannose-6-phosphate isomerase-like protein (cupin superfamily)
VDEPIALAPGEGEVLVDEPSRWSRIKAARRELFGDEVFAAAAGAFVLAPPGVVHWFRNASDAPARVLNLHAPGGFGEYRRELEALRERGVEPDRAFFEGHDIFDVD